MTVLAQPSILILLFIAQRDKLGYAFIVDGSPQKYVYFKKKKSQVNAKYPKHGCDNTQCVEMLNLIFLLAWLAEMCQTS